MLFPTTDLYIIFLYFLAIDGGYSDWFPCSVVCGGGTRERTCTNPVPENGGEDCTSLGVTEEDCSTDDCPSNIYNFCTVKCVFCFIENALF
jgi:hypothetical protein